MLRELLLGRGATGSAACCERGRPVVARPRSRGPLTEEDYRYLHDTHGLPRELVNGLLSEAD